MDTETTSYYYVPGGFLVLFKYFIYVDLFHPPNISIILLLLLIITILQLRKLQLSYIHKLMNEIRLIYQI